MKNITKILLAALATVSMVSCKDYLGQNSISTVDNDFVFSSIETAKTVIYGAYNGVVETFNSGIVTNFDAIGSDVEHCSAALAAADLCGAAQLYGGQSNYTPEGFNINSSNVTKYWDTWYSSISKCNQIINNIKAMSNYEDLMKNTPNEWSDLLGQAYALRATLYRELTWHYGDCIYYTENEAGQDIKELTNRDYILEKEIEALIAIEPLMYKIGENGHMPDQMTKNYVDGLIGRLCFQEAGYQTRRTDLGDDFYTDKDGNKISIDVWGTDDSRKAAYGRRSDWKKFYEMALPWLKKGVTETGEARLETVDNRTDKEGRSYGNPYQVIFDDMNKQKMSYESIFEFSIKEEGGGSRMAYNFGRGSNGGSNAYPPKANAQTCSFPNVFYGMFDPQDLRRDVSVNVTLSSGNGSELIYNYDYVNKNGLGIGCNKYDPNRHPNPNQAQLKSGINYLMMRQADIILMYAEALAVTGSTNEAKTELKKIHDRAFPDKIQDAKFEEFLAQNGGDVFEAIINERKLEFIAENLRRWDLIRTGKLPQVAVEYRKTLINEANDIETKGFVQYANGNQFPAYIWTKTMNGKEVLGYRLTMQTPEGLDKNSDEYALLYPGWRGQHDDWVSVAVEDGVSPSTIEQVNTNLAIKGLTELYYPKTKVTVTCTTDSKNKTVKKGDILKTVTLTSYNDVLQLKKDMDDWKDGDDVIASTAIDEDGYALTPWGIGMLKNETIRANWTEFFMVGYSDADYAAKKAPIYLTPMNETVCTTTGLKNGYGFKSTAN